MKAAPNYPTIEHERAAQAIVDFFAKSSDVAAVLLTCSCARGKATPDSCLDISVLLQPTTTPYRQAKLARKWEAFHAQEKSFASLAKVGKFSHLDLEFTEGRFWPGDHGPTSGPDNFELEIGNTLAYSVPLCENGEYLARLKARWLPYYDEELRRKRLAMVRHYCLNNLDHILLFVPRGLYFQAFDRFYHAFGEFLQALFIKRRVYPIAYDKWVREQVEEILGLPELYRQLPGLFETDRFESDALVQKEAHLRALLEEYAAEE